jgi:hypothetical protein
LSGRFSIFRSRSESITFSFYCWELVTRREKEAAEFIG